jgi:hypothetical protein
MIPQTEVPLDDKSSTPTTTPTLPVGPAIGFKSSEFAATVATAVAIGSGHVPANYVPLVAALVGLYTAARTLLKVVHALGYAKKLPDLPQLPENLK